VKDRERKREVPSILSPQPGPSQFEIRSLLMPNDHDTRTGTGVAAAAASPSGDDPQGLSEGLRRTHELATEGSIDAFECLGTICESVRRDAKRLVRTNPRQLIGLLKQISVSAPAMLLDLNNPPQQTSQGKPANPATRQRIKRISEKTARSYLALNQDLCRLVRRQIPQLIRMNLKDLTALLDQITLLHKSAPGMLVYCIPEIKEDEHPLSRSLKNWERRRAGLPPLPPLPPRPGPSPDEILADLADKAAEAYFDLMIAAWKEVHRKASMLVRHKPHETVHLLRHAAEAQKSAAEIAELWSTERKKHIWVERPPHPLVLSLKKWREEQGLPPYVAPS
jgi:hypothetical protein